MSVDRYEREYHLTPRGWEVGTFSVYGHVKESAISPKDRVLTVVRQVEQSSDYSSDDVWWVEQWRSSDASVVEKLLEEFGHRPTHRD